LGKGLKCLGLVSRCSALNLLCNLVCTAE